MKSAIAIIGNGYVGRAYSKMFPDAIIYDEPREELLQNKVNHWADKQKSRDIVNSCHIAIVCVPTELGSDGKLNMSIVNDVVDWLQTDLILIKSALQPGTADRLVKTTGKNIAVSVELIGMGNYYVDPSEFPDPTNPSKHKTLVIGGDEDTTARCAEFLWNKMQPNIKIHLVSALEAEITKLVENSYPALKVSFINALYELCKSADANFIKVQQAWSSDSRVDGFHMRTLSWNRGWSSHCWSKDVPALATYAEEVGAKTMSSILRTIIDVNQVHRNQNVDIN